MPKEVMRREITQLQRHLACREKATLILLRHIAVFLHQRFHLTGFYLLYFYPYIILDKPRSKMSTPKRSGDHLLKMLPFAMPWKKGVAVLLVAYFDASARESDMFALAGLAFEAEKAIAAAARWQELWGKTRCHMTDLHSGRERPGNPFFGWSDDKAGDYLKKSIAIINEHVSYVVANSCQGSAIGKLGLVAKSAGAETFMDAYRAAYPFCMQFSMAALVDLMDNASDPSNVAYFIEKGDVDQGFAMKFLNSVTSDGKTIKYPEINSYFRHESHTFLSKDCSRLFEMVDILAWEWAKHMERLMQRKKMRPSLMALLGPGESGETYFKSPTRCAFHSAGPLLHQHVEDVQSQILF